MNQFAISLVSRGPELGVLVEQAARFLEAAKAHSTRQAYARGWADFRLFTQRHSLPFLPSTPEVVALYISDLAIRLSVSTIRRRMAAITNAHKEAGFPDSPASPRQHFVVREVLAGIKRSLGTVQHGVDPLLIDDIRNIVAAATPDRLLGLRDRALVLVGFSGAFRRSELATIYNRITAPLVLRHLGEQLSTTPLCTYTNLSMRLVGLGDNRTVHNVAASVFHRSTRLGQD